MKRVLLAMVGALLIVQPGSVRMQAQTGSSFPFFQNFFITGDYAVGGVGLRGSGVGTIEIDGVPPTADILGAFLYWQSVVSTPTLASASTGVMFDGNPIGGAEGVAGTIAVRVSAAGSTPCWAAGGATGSANGSKVLAMFRADVLRFLDEDDLHPTNPAKLLIDKDDRFAAGLDPGFEVTVPDGGSGSGLPLALGASLVILYREPSMPLRSVVIYNGAHTLDQGTTSFNLTLGGFYQAVATATAHVTPIVGDGQPNFSERLVIGSDVYMNPFTGTELGEDWDNPTFNVSLAAGASSLAVLIDNEGLSSFDCLSIGAVVMSTEVKDVDQDGLVDLLEDGVPPNDPNGDPLPNLKAMGAGSDKRDVFFEVGYHTTGGYTEPEPPLGQGVVAAHNHLPDPLAIQMVGDALKNAPAKGTIPAGIRAHIDVGPLYPSSVANAYVIGKRPGESSTLARGGESFPEVDCLPSATQDCDFPNFRGTVGWKTGYRTLRDQVFDDNRHHSFRYVLFAHALGLRRSEFACLNGTTPVPGDANDVCPPGTTPNPAFSSPTKTSGIADPPGGDAMVTLGFWDNFKGTTFMQAATWLHEFGHNGFLRHGGAPTVESGALVFQPNCKPNYESVMNYMFQTRGLICDGTVTAATAPACVNALGQAVKVGQPVIDFSRQVLGGLNEGVDGGSLVESAGLGNMAYRTRWYAENSPLDVFIGTTASSKHCDGSPLGALETGLFRIEGTAATGAIDWNNDGVIVNSSEDITFSGTLQSLAPGSNDWANLDLRHVASRRNVAGLSLQMEDETLSPGDPASGDLGKGDVGKGDVGKGDVGKGDVGKGDVGKGDVGAPFGDLDLDTARHVGNSPTLAVPVVSKPAISLSWTAPHVDAAHVTRYKVWRSVGATASPTPLLVADLGPVGGVVPTTFADTTVKNNTLYTYFVQAEITVPSSPVVLTGASNYQTVLKK